MCTSSRFIDHSPLIIQIHELKEYRPVANRWPRIPQLIFLVTERFHLCFSGLVESQRYFYGGVVDQQALTAARWEGNVRQLENLLERLLILVEGGIIGKKDLPEEVL